jgi:hypothetical protein
MPLLRSGLCAVARVRSGLGQLNGVMKCGVRSQTTEVTMHIVDVSLVCPAVHLTLCSVSTPSVRP